MAEPEKSVSFQRVMIIAGESSGEMYGALLAAELRARHPMLEISGIGGDKMARAGVKLLARIASSFGLIEAIRTFRQLRRAYAAILDSLASQRPQALILIDYPDFNMKIAPRARALGIPVLYYVSPQVWAWRAGRVRKMVRIADFLAAILPFEEKIYQDAGMACAFVGHPVFDEIRAVITFLGFQEGDIGSEALRRAAKSALGCDPDRPLLVVMPGSRSHEINLLLPALTESLRQLKQTRPDYQYVVPVAPNLPHTVQNSLRFGLEHGTDLNVRIVDDALLALMAAECGIIASGTSTLQAALLGVPHVVVYRLSPLTFWLGKRIVKVRYISLSNILLDTLGTDAAPFRIVELLQDDANPAAIAAEVMRLTDNAAYRADCLRQFELVRELFRHKHATAVVADRVEMFARGAGAGST
ncbi:MAG TPA: lipid-A-disaccharide synthase [Dissulfurispiraceae bacterium]|nr:lipid-A-disaccharide synthase [Dissulfurispiraceae bacterium]